MRRPLSCNRRVPRGALLALALCALSARPAVAQQIKSRVMVLLDTSGSMGFHFIDPQLPLLNPPGGDYPGGDGSTVYSDKNGRNQSLFPGKDLGNGTRDGVNSRLYAAKTALTEAINAYAGNIEFGLETYDFQLCPFNNPMCQQCQIQKIGNTYFYNCLYADNAFTKLLAMNWIGPDCSSSIPNGQVLVLPGAGSEKKMLPWIDGIEDHTSSGDGVTDFGTGSTPVNPELRASGPTPLGESIDGARMDWYDAVKGNDPQINCRPYVLVVATDGVQSVGGTCGRDPAAAILALSKDNPQNPVLTYVIGLSITPQDKPTLNSMAVNGGTVNARFANTQQDIEAAFADIAASSIKFEACNGQDDNCNGLVDEGFDKGAKCSVGVGACQKGGIKKCTQDGAGTQCCVDDGNPNSQCVPLQAGMPGKEICNFIDDDCNGIVDDPPVCQQGGCRPEPEICNGKDDDCDGLVDNGLIDVGKTCGLNIGACMPGLTACVPNQGKGFPDPTDHLVCMGAVGASPEKCNNIDDDCDGVVDGLTQPCYSGPNGTDNIGTCHDGQQKCSAGVWGACVGEKKPGAEVCNGLDDDCNNKVDDVPGAGVSCCPSKLCGVGACVAGTMQCSGGSLQCVGYQGPTPEVCDGADNDCNMKVDDIAGLGKACVALNGCAGTIVCVPQKKSVTCQPAQMNCGGNQGCNNDPNLGKPCGNVKGLPPPCMAGVFVCKNGMLYCQGEVGPSPEVCDGVDNDCDGNPDNGAICPMDFVCWNGQCDPVCGGGEFPCPGGFSEVVMNGQCVCVPDRTCTPACTLPLYCDPRTGTCTDPCAGVKCPDGEMCDRGLCYGCEKFGCAAACTRCDQATHQCVSDKCCNVKCTAPSFCDPTSGACVSTCPNGCPTGQICANGVCVGDPCAGKKCAEGFACNPASGECEADACATATCSSHLACCKGACVADPCEVTNCPPPSVCSVNPLTCEPGCGGAVEDRVVGAGGGLTCAISSRRNPGGALGLALALLLLARTRRRR